MKQPLVRYLVDMLAKYIIGEAKGVVDVRIFGDTVTEQDIDAVTNLLVLVEGSRFDRYRAVVDGYNKNGPRGPFSMGDRFGACVQSLRGIAYLEDLAYCTQLNIWVLPVDWEERVAELEAWLPRLPDDELPLLEQFRQSEVIATRA